MGTNYYFIYENVKIHIGKQSGGWKFLFREYPDLNTMEHWAVFLTKGVIQDEYDTCHSWADFFGIVMDNRNKQAPIDARPSFYCSFSVNKFS